MKKTTLVMACLAILTLVASCKKDPVTPETPTTPDAPTITLMEGDIFAGQDTQVYAGDQITVGFNANGEKLTKIELDVTCDGESIYSNSETIESQDTYNYTHTFTVDAAGTVTITGTVTDAVDQIGTTSFSIVSIEKPNAKFIGHYEGEALFSGNIVLIPSPMIPYDTINQQVDDQAIAVLLDIAEGETINDVIATCIINDSISTAKGVVDGDKVIFEAIEDQVTYPLPENVGMGYINEITISMRYDIIGTLNDKQLILDGTCKGDKQEFYGSITLDGTIGGSLTKTE